VSRNGLCGPDGKALGGLAALVHVFAPQGGRAANRALRRLNLSDNGLGEDAAALLARGLLAEPACGLAELDLRRNRLGGPRGYAHLAYGLRDHPDPGKPPNYNYMYICILKSEKVNQTVAPMRWLNCSLLYSWRLMV
jgi:hypothetical protein